MRGDAGPLAAGSSVVFVDLDVLFLVRHAGHSFLSRPPSRIELLVSEGGRKLSARQGGKFCPSGAGRRRIVLSRLVIPVSSIALSLSELR